MEGRARILYPLNVHINVGKRAEIAHHVEFVMHDRQRQWSTPPGEYESGKSTRNVK